MTDTASPRRFNPWPWVAPAVLTIVLLANILLIHLATSTDDHLVSDDWYERGLRWDERSDGDPATPEPPAPVPAEER